MGDLFLLQSVLVAKAFRGFQTNSKLLPFHQRKKGFKLDSIHSVKNILMGGDFSMSLDL
jgi:hypothetical protein